MGVVRAQLQEGQRVQIYDEGLARLNEILGYTEDEAPNNKGVIARLDHDTLTAEINFDDGVSAPYDFDLIVKVLN